MVIWGSNISLVANFIVISKYANQSIRELVCVQRDATSLWVLFCNTIPEIRIDFICNLIF